MHADLERFWQFCYYISSISSLLQKFHFPKEENSYFLKTKFFVNTKRPGTSFHVADLQNFLINFFLLYYDINCPNFINRLRLPPNLFSKMHFLIYA